MFNMPDELPPNREVDHQIRLKEGTNPINVKPYKYPHAQKDEIEKMINEMLTTGVIRPSVSPFSSPVILDEKKDGSWRLCGLQVLEQGDNTG